MADLQSVTNLSSTDLNNKATEANFIDGILGQFYARRNNYDHIKPQFLARHLPLTAGG
jgi:hypothetical protein